MSFASDSIEVQDHQHMSRALMLAKKGLYTTDPNPRVGCVIVRDNCILAEAWHQRAGCLHAEALALQQAGQTVQGATAYVTLEPCSHFGKTPPCADALIAAGVKRVVAAMQDPNPLVAGQGLARLHAAGIEVSSGILESQAKALNVGFIKRMQSAMPYVRVKMAMSLDGRTAMQSGESQWITGSASRADVQRLRARSSAIVTGVDSVLQDDPQLTVRDANALGETVERQPLRVVLDSHMRMPPSAKVLSADGQVLWVTALDVSAEQQLYWQQNGVDLISLPNKDSQIDLQAMLKYVAQHYACNECLIEAGSRVVGSFAQENLIDEWVVYMATVLLGSDARPLAQLSLQKMQQQKHLKLTDLRIIGEDIRLTLQPK